MQIIVKCPACKRAWLLDAGVADKRIRCLNCKKLFKVPKLEEMPGALDVIRGAKGAIYVDSTGKTYG